MLRSSKAVDKWATKVAVWWRGASPDPGLGPGVKVLRGDARRLLELFGIGKVLAGEGLAAEEPPPAFLQIAPTRPGRDRHRMYPRMDRQPVLDGATGVAGAMVRDQVPVAGGVGGGERREQARRAGRGAGGGGAGELPPIRPPARAVEPD